MSSSDLIRWGAIGFMLGGVVWVVLGLLVVARDPGTAPGRVEYVLFIVALLLLALGLVGLHALQRGRYRRIGRGGFYTVLVATMAQILGTVVLLSGSTVLRWLVYPVGTMGLVVGFTLYGAATLQAKMLPRWYGVLLIIFLPVSTVLMQYGNIWLGLVSLVLGYVLWSRRGVSAEQTTPVGTE